MRQICMRKIKKTCVKCELEFSASCGVERYCSNECMFLASFEKRGECWIWKAQRDKDGYGVMRLKGRGRIKAHRFSFQLGRGEIPPGLMVRHTCDTPECVNPDHLVTGTALDNKKDCIERLRHCRGEQHHKARLTRDDVRAILSSGDSGAEAARVYGVTKENIYAIRKRSTWKDV
jgi:hypothetical protein